LLAHGVFTTTANGVVGHDKLVANLTSDYLVD